MSEALSADKVAHTAEGAALFRPTAVSISSTQHAALDQGPIVRWIFLGLALVCGAAPAQPQHGPPGGHSPGRCETSAGFSAGIDAGMAKMMRDMHAPVRSCDPDIDFLAMMIPHHEGAVEMARLLLIHGRDPLTRKLAEEIIAGQVVEIEGMKRRLAALRAAAAPEQDAFPALGGTRGGAE